MRTTTTGEAGDDPEHSNETVGILDGSQGKEFSHHALFAYSYYSYSYSYYSYYSYSYFVLTACSNLTGTLAVGSREGTPGGAQRER
eukprot:1339815-Amorphochlora_amoeboformis.AAC.1